MRILHTDRIKNEIHISDMKGESIYGFCSICNEKLLAEIQCESHSNNRSYGPKLIFWCEHISHVEHDTDGKMFFVRRKESKK